jgi:hypothetical protein
MKAIKLIIISIMLSLPNQLLAKDNDTSAKAYYFVAKQHIENMLSGKEPMSYEKAIFEVENAWWEGTMDYLFFERALKFHVSNIEKLAISYGDRNLFNQKDSLDGTKEQKNERYKNLLLNFAIYKYMTSESIWVVDDSMICHRAYHYSIKDPMGTNDWTNTQITTLLNSGTGNCFALSSLFKIFSERLNSDAKLCTAPGHMYICHADEKGTQYNIEIGSRTFPGTGTIETITYTPNEAVKNRIALRELDTRQSIALCLVYLAKGMNISSKTSRMIFNYNARKLH